MRDTKLVLTVDELSEIEADELLTLLAASKPSEAAAAFDHEIHAEYAGRAPGADNAGV